MWHPDGNRIVYTSQGVTIPRMYWFNLDDGTSEPVHDSDISEWPASFSPDGKTLAYMRTSGATNYEIWTLTEGEEAKPFIDIAARCFCPRFHPSGDYIAYSSDESDVWEVYIRPFGRTGRRIQVSVGGGVDPRWSPSGDELYYRNGYTVFAVSISIDGRLRVGQPEALFDFPFGPRVSQYAPNFDVHPDGNKFIITENTADVRNIREFVVVKNWIEELKKLVP